MAVELRPPVRGRRRGHGLLPVAADQESDAPWHDALVASEPDRGDTGVTPAGGPARFDKFLALLDRPAKPNPRLRRTMKSAPPWEAG
ncbi:MAG: DUF1778 domain-containing protein [Burkholderiales bacterium]|nr:DUF1778 domain-containing protein [Burkholderiales bacterium]